jgi:hypothetical protein
MSNKMECPGCNSYTSDINRAFEQGDPCPTCGLSCNSAIEIIELKGKRANKIVTSIAIEVTKSRDEWQRRALKAEQILREIKWKLEDDE